MTNSKYTKNNFINELSKKTGFSKSISKKIINDLLEIIIMNISTGKFVLKNIGTFKLLKILDKSFLFKLFLNTFRVI